MAGEHFDISSDLIITEGLNEENFKGILTTSLLVLLEVREDVWLADNVASDSSQFDVRVKFELVVKLVEQEFVTEVAKLEEEVWDVDKELGDVWGAVVEDE